jgi:hypothetical protein
MSKVSKSIYFFGWYSLMMGAVLLFIPNIILPLFGLPVSNDPWLRLLGFVLLCSSWYYIRSAKDGNYDFARYTTHTRFTAPVVVVVLVITKQAEWPFLLFGIVDGLGGFWTWFELKAETRKLTADHE